MDLVLGSRKFTVRPILVARVGNTDNIAFGIYEEGKLIAEFRDLSCMGDWMTSIVIDETLDEEPLK